MGRRREALQSIPGVSPKMARILDRIARSRTPGVLLRELLSGLRVESQEAPADQDPLPITKVRQASGDRTYLAPTSGQLFPWETVSCRLGGTLQVRACLDRHAACWPSGGRKGTPKFRECAGCQIGEAYRARCPTYQPPKDSQPAEVMGQSQRRAKAQQRATRLSADDDGLEMDPMQQVALSTPDDKALP